MGFLNHLFGGRKATAKELRLDAKKRIKLWEEHMKNYKEREELSKRFNFGNVDNALKDLKALDELLKQIEGLISEDVITIESEERTDEEILFDLKALTSKKKVDEFYKLRESTATQSKREHLILKLFNEIHYTLMLELRTIRRLMEEKKPKKMKDMLTYLFRLIFHNEAPLYTTFMKQSYDDHSFFKEVDRIAKAILLEEKIEEKIESEEQKFINRMVKIVGTEDSKHHLRIAAEEIYQSVLLEAGAPFSHDEEFEEIIERINQTANDDRILYTIIKKEFPKYSEEKIKQVMKAFKRSFNLGHLEGSADMYT